MDEFEVIDPEVESALDEINRSPVQEESTVLDLLNKRRIRIKYKPQSMAQMMQATQGISTKARSNPTFDFTRWAKEVLPKLNSALLNIRVVNDLDGKDPGKGELRFSLIGSGEYKRLYALCFPGYAFDPAEDSRDEDHVVDRKVGKGVRKVAAT
jgi:hypothetical protein